MPLENIFFATQKLLNITFNQHFLRNIFFALTLLYNFGITLERKAPAE